MFARTLFLWKSGALRRPRGLAALSAADSASWPPPSSLGPTQHHGGSGLTHSRRCKGDYGFNVFHNSNPQHGGSYARHERRMREDEVEDFLNSVKGWTPVLENTARSHEDEGTGGAASSSGDDVPPPPSPLQVGEEAIQRTFHFESYREAYLFMGRMWAFCYGSDKYPNVVWEGSTITAILYSPSFRGLSKREARVAAFLNDQYNMVKKSRRQQQMIVEGVAKRAAVEQVVGQSVTAHLRERERQRTKPLKELVNGPTTWDDLVSKQG